MRSRHGGSAKNIVHTIISTDVMILAATTCPSLPAFPLLVPGTCNSASLWIEHPELHMGAYSQVGLPVKWIVGSMCRSVLENVLGAFLESSVKQDRSVHWSAIGSVLERMSGSVLGTLYRSLFEAQVKQAGSIQSIVIRSVSQRVFESM